MPVDVASQTADASIDSSQPGLTSRKPDNGPTMRALVYTGPNKLEVLDRPMPTIQSPTDAIVKMLHSTICGTDLHILKGDVPAIPYDRILGHEGVGTVVSVGSAIDGLSIGDNVVIAAITACKVCASCRKGLEAHCVTGGWRLGNKIDGTQAEYVRIPHATSSLYKIPNGLDLRACAAISDALPTGLECGTLSAHVQPGSTVAIIGAGPVGLAVMLTARLYTPSRVVMIDLDDTRLEHAKGLGADHAVNPGNPDAMETLNTLTEGEGFDCVIEAVGIPKTFEMCQKLVAPGGSIANVGVHGNPVNLDMHKLWDRNISIKMQLLNAVSIPTLLRLYQSGHIKPANLFTHNYPFSEVHKAYHSFQMASQEGALKVAIDF
ncbi:alcohol dehydrogenase [Aspergillus bombycis]|uniref:Alcohol dehydrogenase n=1 Tax=Aspergillus bombycis TaxID=109264 RepID=A0A1F7ZUY3_9EURO|nr:alcohol dehydrogenase [Aspergillus bombycis]OGM43283.1 alcohol dehydrogenase [Aspergillus bombycis]